ncbi:MAG TPA: O-antigen ligase family protein [Gaiellaceae bacterium]|nr:O-antigen ligase family protein [Gaiellaceae bacterium]
MTRFLFLATLFSITFEKVHWEVGGTLTLADVLTILFIGSFAVDRVASRDTRLARTALVVLAFAGAFLAVYLLGFWNLETVQGVNQFSKGLVKFVLHFGFLSLGVAYLLRHGRDFALRAFAVFVAGIVANAAYGIVQLAVARVGLNLDTLFLSPLTRGASQINVYGTVGGEQSVYRPNALTGDPNHLGIMLLVPILALTPLYLRRPRPALAALLGFLLVVQIATLSRSGLLGLGLGVLVLAAPYGRELVSRATVVPIALVAALLAWVVSRRLDFFAEVIRSRVQTGDAATSAHFGVYDFIPDVLSTNPLFGLGLNNFSVYYEFVTGKDNWGPHSFYVALLVETGLVGTTLFGLFLWWMFRRLREARRFDARLAWGLTAALAATMAANVFYLTMQFYYFYAFAAFALALPLLTPREPRADAA